MFQIRLIAVLISLCFCISSAHANHAFRQMWQDHPFYFGPLLGFGSTDWSMMTINCDTHDPDCQSDVLSVSAPISAGDSGLSWGATMGYEIQPMWAAEASFIRFPTTSIQFDKSWSYYKNKYNITEIRSDTWTIFFVGKFLTQIGHSGLRGFANAGLNFTSRSDALTHKIKPGPTFGLGLNYVFPTQFMLELGFQYMAGFGRCTEIPAKYYIPFLYSIHAKLIYRI